MVKVYLGGYSYLSLVILWPNYQVISFSKVNWNVCMGKAINITFQGEQDYFRLYFGYVFSICANLQCLSSNFATTIRSMVAKQFSLAAFQHVLSPCLISLNVRSKSTIFDRQNSGYNL